MPSVSFRIAPRFFFVKQNIMLFPTRSVAFAWFFHIFQLAHLHQNDIIPNLAHILKRNDILLLSPKNPAQAPGSRDDQMRDAAVFRIKFYIAHKAQLFTVTDVDDFFFFKSKMRTEPPHFFLVYSMRILIIWFHPEIITETALYQRKTAAALQPDSPANQIPAPASEEPQEYRFQILLRILKFLQTEKVPT